MWVKSEHFGTIVQGKNDKVRKISLDTYDAEILLPPHIPYGEEYNFFGDLDKYRDEIHGK